MRNRALERVLGVLVALRSRPHTLVELAFRFGTCERTIRRDIEALEAVRVPIRTGRDSGGEPGHWWIDRSFRL